MQTNTALKQEPSSLANQWEELKKTNAGIRIRDAAVQLGVSEAELLLTGLGKNVTRLKNDYLDILKALTPLGEVMALTRNDHVVHERKGVYDNISAEHGGKIGLVVNPDIDLRLFLTRWFHAFAVSEESRGKLRHSIQFFDKDGSAIHKIYLTDESDESLYAPLVEKFKSDDQESAFAAEAYAPKRGEMPDAMIDAEGFRADWRALKDTHDFFLLLGKYRMGREQSLRVAGSEEFAYKLKGGALRGALELAASKKCEIMVFAGNPGCLQIHSGLVERLVEHGGFYNVLDEKFNLHAREEAITSAWVVLKPSVDGLITSVECFDKDGEMLVQLFGKRKPGTPELALWRELVAELPKA